MKLKVAVKLANLAPEDRRWLARWLTNKYVWANNRPTTKPPTQGVGVKGFEAFGPMGRR